MLNLMYHIYFHFRHKVISGIQFECALVWVFFSLFFWWFIQITLDIWLWAMFGVSMGTQNEEMDFFF